MLDVLDQLPQAHLISLSTITAGKGPPESADNSIYTHKTLFSDQNFTPKVCTCYSISHRMHVPLFLNINYRHEAQ